MINLKDFIIESEQLQTGAFQRAVDYSFNNGNEPIFVPFGTYTLASVELKSNTTLVFEDGVKLLGTRDLDAYFQDEERKNNYQDLSHSSYTKSMFFARNAENIILRGNATIDMQSGWDYNKKRKERYRGAKPIAFDRVNVIKILGLTINYATDLAILLGRCKNILIDGLKTYTYIDGINLDGCEDAVISNCNLVCGDDGLVIKSSFYDNEFHECRRITATNCIIQSNCNAIKIGTETNGDFKYITIDNCVVYNTRCSGIAIESADGSNISGINISNITMQNVSTPIFVYACRRMRAPKGTPIGTINDVYISNVYADINPEVFRSIQFGFHNINLVEVDYQNASITSSVVNLSDKPMKNINLTNITLKVQGGKKLSDIDSVFKPDGYPNSDNFGRVLPASGLYIKNADVTLNNVKIITDEPDERPEILVDNSPVE